MCSGIEPIARGKIAGTGIDAFSHLSQLAERLFRLCRQKKGFTRSSVVDFDLLSFACSRLNPSQERNRLNFGGSRESGRSEECGRLENFRAR
jgi:hypothetical protein